MDEKTLEALKKAKEQNKKVTEDQVSKVSKVSKEPKKDVKKEPQKTQKPQKPVNKDPEIDGGLTPDIKIQKGELQHNEIVLGPNKSVQIKPWTGKTKKKIRKFFEGVERPEDIDFVAVIKTLIYDYVKGDVFLSDGEQQYLLLKIRDISLDDKIDVSVECPQCYVENNIKASTDDIIKYKENGFPIKFNDDIELVDIESLTYLEEQYEDFIQSDDYDGITTFADIESALHIKMKDKTLKEVIEYLDDAPIKETQAIFKTLRETLPDCSLEYQKMCSGCRTEVTFPIDVTEDIFEALLQ